MKINKVNFKEVIFLICCVTALVLFFSVRSCYGMDFCEFIDVVQETYCPTTSSSSSTTTTTACPTTTTTSLPLPEFCGEATREEINDVINASHETYWDTEYHLVSYESLIKFLEATLVDLRGKSGWYDCDDYVKILLGRVVEWAPGIAFGMTWTVTNGESHAVNIFVDCNLDVWKIEPHYNTIDPWDDDIYVILLREE